MNGASSTARRTALALALAVVGASATAAELTVVNFGGANGDAQKAAFNQPFEKATGNKVTAVEYNGEQAKVKAMVEAKHVNWDVVEVESGDLNRGCDEGLYEKLDWSKIAKKSDLIPEAPQVCGVGFFVWSTALSYNADKLKSAPTGWADFWNVKKWPGKRALRKGAKTTLEIALMADGVAPKDVYKTLGTPAGVDRAFKKLDEIKPNMVWWEKGSQPPQLLASGEVAMTDAYNGRIAAANEKDKKNFKIVWHNNLYTIDSWVIMKGSPNKAQAETFLQFVSDPQYQKNLPEKITYGPTTKASTAMIDKKVLPELATAPQNMASALPINDKFWLENLDKLSQRFNAWVAK